MSMREKSALFSPPPSFPVDFDLNTFHNPTSSPHFFVASSISRSRSSFPPDARARVVLALAPPDAAALRPVLTANAGSSTSRFRTDAIRIEDRRPVHIAVVVAVAVVTCFFPVTLDRIIIDFMEEDEDVEHEDDSLRRRVVVPPRLIIVVVADIIITIVNITFLKPAARGRKKE
jgi:hypothetical protein